MKTVTVYYWSLENGKHKKCSIKTGASTIRRAIRKAVKIIGLDKDIFRVTPS